MAKILISPSYGAGWSTWTSEYPECLTNLEIINMVETGVDTNIIEAKAEELWPNGYWGGARSLIIYNVKEGTPFIIEEYDGAETVRYQVDYNWITIN